MIHFIIASHHNMAQGVKETINFLTADAYSIGSICAYVDEKVELAQQIENYLEAVKDQDTVFVFTDMIGGSVTQQFYPYLSERFHVITGINLPLVLSLVLQMNQIQGEEGAHVKELIKSTIEDAKNQIIYLNTMNFNQDEEDE